MKVTFSEAVTATGTPRLQIDMDPVDWGRKWATYESGSGTAELVFLAHTVVEPNYSPYGIAVIENTLDLNGGAIRSTATQTDAYLWHEGLDYDPDHKVDWRKAAPGVPWVTGVAISSEPGDDDTYALGDIVEVKVTFSEAVTATGTPRLQIDMDLADWGRKWATYKSGSGTTSLAFAYEVVRSNLSTQGVAALENTLDLNGGAIRSTATQTGAHLWYEGLEHDPDHKVDWRQPAPGAATVTDVAISSDPGDDDTYALGEVIRVKVTFSEAVDVDATDGAPGLVIDMDPADWGRKWATYESGSGTAELVFFAHTVVEPNLSTQGIAVLKNSLDHRDGVIRSAADQNLVDLRHDGLEPDPDHKVDWRKATSGVSMGDRRGDLVGSGR